MKLSNRDSVDFILSEKPTNGNVFVNKTSHSLQTSIRGQCR